ncbi:MAG: UDP-N-acetylglucosamine 2-epimerase (non-hydrolyzing) [Bacteroidales bacterium]|jgi:UDP-GlcNAc3NAcA epimerase|nr:UDP-N-acetylglucosamine 2-epimerase (non-hydrolyzing) [Bacteroidales bacterium]
MKIITIVGARPQFIKAAVVSRAIKKEKSIREIIVHTGQHFDRNMSEIFFEQMHIPKYDYNLNISNLPHGAMTGRMLETIENVLLKENPNLVLVYGDTNSTLAGVLAAKKMHIKVAHVEAGLRSYNSAMPEEINRIITDRISDILFCPTQSAVDNLKKEGFDSMNCLINNCGDVMLDAFSYYSAYAKKPDISVDDRFVLCTIHRMENTEYKDNLLSIVQALETISNEISVVLPVHPKTKAKLKEYHYNIETSNIKFIDPVSYFEMLYLLKHCETVMTDSGGLQKESYFARKKCLVLRNETEWIELVKSNGACPVGTNADNIIAAFQSRNTVSVDFSKKLYGNGNAGSIIVEQLLQLI